MSDGAAKGPDSFLTGNKAYDLVNMGVKAFTNIWSTIHGTLLPAAPGVQAVAIQPAASQQAAQSNQPASRLQSGLLIAAAVLLAAGLLLSMRKRR